IWIIRQMKVFGRAGINRYRNVIRALSQKGRADALSNPAVTLVADHVDDEMDLVGISAKTGSDRIQARLQLRQQADKFCRGEFCRRMINKKIHYFHSPQIRFQVLLASRREQFAKEWCGRSAF